jgi:hypothetical protein
MYQPASSPRPSSVSSTFLPLLLTNFSRRPLCRRLSADPATLGAPAAKLGRCQYVGSDVVPGALIDGLQETEHNLVDRVWNKLSATRRN